MWSLTCAAVRGLMSIPGAVPPLASSRVLGALITVSVLVVPAATQAAKGVPPTVTCNQPCQACTEMEQTPQGPRCLKCGVDPSCLGDGGQSSDMKAMLDAHNGYRARHGTPALTWSASLAKGAQEWAQKCTKSHSTGDYGENLYWGTRSMSTDAAAWWYNEIRFYNFDKPIESYKQGDTDKSKETRHFTQVVWRDTRQLGCGAATCSGQHYWVCRYTPRGNWNGEKPGVLEANVPRVGGAPGGPTSSSSTKPKSVPLPSQPPAGQAGGGEWSAFASDKKGRWGYAVHQASQQGAQAAAASGCGGAGVGCQVFWTTRDRCVAYAESRQGGFWFAAGGGANEDAAKKNAVRFCQSGTAPANSCKTILSRCR